MPTDPAPEGLMACPFCGDPEPAMHEIPAHTHHFATFMPDHPGSWTIECHHCGIGMIRATDTEARAAWNRRAPSPREAEMEAEVVRLTIELNAARAFGGGFFADVVKETTREVYRQNAARALASGENG